MLQSHWLSVLQEWGKSAVCSEMPRRFLHSALTVIHFQANLGEWSGPGQSSTKGLDLALKDASKDMKSNEKVVLAAVQQTGYALNKGTASCGQGMNDYALAYACKGLRAKVDAIREEFGCDDKVAALALAQPRVLQLSAKYVTDDGSGEDKIIVTCTNLGGNTVAQVASKPDCNSRDLRLEISESLNVPHPVIRLLLPSGKLLRGHEVKSLFVAVHPFRNLTAWKTCYSTFSQRT